MRYEKGRKETTRRRILDVASQRFRRDGIAAVGIAGIMTEAGLTNGAFYSHFSSKEDLVRGVLIDALEQQVAEMSASGDDGIDLQSVLNAYLSPLHRDERSSGCPSAALLPEVALRPTGTRAAYTLGIKSIIDLLSHATGDRGDATRSTGIAVFALALGAVQLARAVADQELSDEILKSGIRGADKLMGYGNDAAPQ